MVFELVRENTTNGSRSSLGSRLDHLFHMIVEWKLKPWSVKSRISLCLFFRRVSLTVSLKSASEVNHGAYGFSIVIL